MDIFKIKTPAMNNCPPPPTIPLGYPLGIPIVVNLEDESKVESDPTKLISDDSSSEENSTIDYGVACDQK